MPKINNRGMSQIVVLFVLLGGIILGTFLVQQQTQLFSNASELLAPSCDVSSQCKAGYICKNRGCDFSKECANPKSAICAIKKRFCGGKICVIDPNAYTASSSAVSKESSSSATTNPKSKPNPTPHPSAKTPVNKACIQVITKACFKGDQTNCKIFPTPCDVPEGWVVN